MVSASEYLPRKGDNKSDSIILAFLTSKNQIFAHKNRPPIKI
jgi:hypothetical protein